MVVPLIVPAETSESGAAEFDFFGPPDQAIIESTAVAAEAEATRLTALLAPLRVGLVHGKLRPSDRDAEMARFQAGLLDVLVGTTVVEVGVDVPEATMMIIESADRFGLAQLHQLRGRVGRGREESFCVLVAGGESPSALERLNVVARTTDGFEIAEADLALRGPGDFLGQEQSGDADFKFVDFSRDAALIDEVRKLPSPPKAAPNSFESFALPGAADPVRSPRKA